MAVQTSAGTTIGISGVLPATDDSAGYGALTFTPIGEVTDLGEYGKVFNLVTHNPIATRRTEKFKGSFNEGSISMGIGEDTSDAGQGVLDIAVEDDASYAFEITAQDGDIDYFQAKVMSKTVNVGSVDSIRSSTVQLEITSGIVDA